MKISHIALIALLGAAVAAPALAQPGPGGGRFGFNKDNTPGWTLMTAEEHVAHRDKMFAAKSYDECKAFQGEHHKLMEVRAKEKGVTLRTPRQNACDRMKARGLFK
ncbi:MAG: hypothetical protein Q8L93_12300 [Rhodocyclaceae bacterium]|nr:hypothetical protein [Rhodocyclaceae bacterium]